MENFLGLLQNGVTQFGQFGEDGWPYKWPYKVESRVMFFVTEFLLDGWPWRLLAYI